MVFYTTNVFTLRAMQYLSLLLYYKYKIISGSSLVLFIYLGFPGGASGKESACQCRRLGFGPWVGKIPWRRKWQTTPVFLPGESHEQRSLVGCSPWRHKGLDTTEQLNNKFRSTATVLFLSLSSMGTGSNSGMRRVGKYTGGLPGADCLINVEMRVGRNGPSVCLSALSRGFASWHSSGHLVFIM